MADKDNYIFKNPAELLRVLITLAPDINVRVALLEVVDYILSFKDGDVVDTDDILEVACEGLAYLHTHVGQDDDGCDDDDDEPVARPKEDFSGMDLSAIMDTFRKQMEDRKKGDK